jgi:bacteriocin biosynthesis cyclodehydratase domain-containing protein
MSRLPLRPCLALPFTILTAPNRVRLIAGEDIRYTLDAVGLETWLPPFLSKLDGRLLLDDLLAALPEDRRPAAQDLMTRLYGERVLIDGPPEAAHRPAGYGLQVEGTGPLADGLRAAQPVDSGGARRVTVLCQDRLDYQEMLGLNAQLLEGEEPWLWATVGPVSRGYVSPVILPDAGPCLQCLLTHFRRLSPAPDLYDDLVDHARQGRPIRPVPFPPHGLEMLRQVVLRKVELLREPEPPAALFQLHVLEVGALEITAHRVFCDPECPACSSKR